MTFVGTRPEVPKFVKEYTDEMYATLLLPAGVTSMASICYKDEERLLQGVCGEEADRVYVEKILPEKMKHNLKELGKNSFFHDCTVISKTVFAVFR